MNIRKYAVAHSILGLAALAGCAVAPADTVEESTSSTSSALTLPSDPNWAAGLSPDAVVLGHDTDGAPFYSCRAAYNGGIVPGKTRANWSTCDISFGGLENQVGPYQTLTPVWTSATYGQIPSTAIPYGLENGQPLYVCRALTSQFLWQVGKVGNGIGGCAYPFGGAEVVAQAYEVLSNKFAFDINKQYVAGGAPLPFNALRAGTEANGTPIYPCIASYNGDAHPGKTEPGWGTCDISFGGREVWVTGSYAVLVAGSTALPLGNAVVAFNGGNESNGSPLGVCATNYGGSLQVGKVIASGACDFPYGGREISLGNTQVLAFHVDPSAINEHVNITLPDGVAVGGSADLTLNDDGSFTFSGHLHDSGAVSYDESIVMVVNTNSGVAFTFTRSGHAKGTIDCPIFTSCSGRDDNWTITGTNAAIAQHWEDLKKGFTWTAQTSASLDLGILWDDAQSAVGTVKQVIAVVGPYLALL